MFQWIRLGTAVPEISLGNPQKNADAICNKLKEAKDLSLLVFPQLCITGNTCGDLLFQSALQTQALKAIEKIAEQTKKSKCITVVCAPLSVNQQLYNCAFVLHNGLIAGIVPKSYLSQEESRWFRSARDLNYSCLEPKQYGFQQNQPIPIGNDLVFDCQSFCFGIELGEDALSPLSPSVSLALGGADIILNPCAMPSLVGASILAPQKSAQLLCAYIQTSTGTGESTTDYVLSGFSMIAELGKSLEESKTRGDYLLCTDVDVEKIRSERQKNSIYHQSAQNTPSVRKIYICNSDTSDGTLAPLRQTPFSPQDPEERQNRCLNIFKLQTEGLCKRLRVTGGNMVIGVSGGLDSTLALLVCAYAAKKMGNSEKSVCGITMPCFGTTDRTYQNSLKLMKALGVKAKEIPIKESVSQHFHDIGHDSNIKDTTYENSQARERTQVLMDMSNRQNAIVVGTGDLSELALGWCTYNGDHMSMYGVNAGIPKTMIYWVIESVIAFDIFPDANEVLRDILETPISPELLPPNEDGTIAQKTEDLVGPYELHDFFLYYVLRHGFSPAKIFTLACRAFSTEYEKETILKWLKTFYRRFFTQQFKRSCMPDGVKIGSVSLSPRGDLKMPSDASYAAWIQELESL